MKPHVVHFGTERTWRGGEAQMLLLAGRSRLRGYSASFVARPGSELAAKARAAGFEVDELDFCCEISPFAARRMGRLLAERRASILHVHDGHAVWIGKAGAWLAGTPAVVATRRVDFPVSGRLKWSAGLDRVIAISECIGGILRSGGVPDSKLRVVHSGIDLCRFRQAGDGETFRSELGLGNWAPLIVNVGSLTDHKGQRYLIEAMPAIREQYTSAHLAIAGKGELQGALTSLVERLGLGDRVHLLGFRSDVPEVLAAADVVAFPSHLEGLCTSAMDAMACSKPVVASDAGGLAEVVADGETGLVVPAKDPAALAGAVCRLLGDEELRRRFGRAGRARVEKRFSAEGMAEGNMAVYRELLGSASDPGPPPDVGEGGER